MSKRLKQKMLEARARLERQYNIGVAQDPFHDFVEEIRDVDLDDDSPALSMSAAG